MATRTQGLFSLATQSRARTQDEDADANQKGFRKTLRMVRAAAQRLRPYLIPDTSPASATCVEQDHDDCASSPSEAARRARVQEAVPSTMWRTLNCADSLTRDVFVLHRIHGYNHAQIASQLRMNLRDVEERVACAVVMISIERQDPQ